MMSDYKDKFFNLLSDRSYKYSNNKTLNSSDYNFMNINNISISSNIIIYIFDYLKYKNPPQFIFYNIEETIPYNILLYYNDMNKYRSCIYIDNTSFYKFRYYDELFQTIFDRKFSYDYINDNQEELKNKFVNYLINHKNISEYFGELTDFLN